MLYVSQLQEEQLGSCVILKLGGACVLGIWNAYSEVSLAPYCLCNVFPICQDREVILRAHSDCKNTLALSVS